MTLRKRGTKWCIIFGIYLTKIGGSGEVIRYRKQVWRSFPYDESVSHEVNEQNAKALCATLAPTFTDKKGKVAKRPFGLCRKCHMFRHRLHRDRIIPGFRGGAYTPENVQYLCANCHEDKSKVEQQEWFNENRERFRAIQRKAQTLRRQKERSRETDERKSLDIPFNLG